MEAYLKSNKALWDDWARFHPQTEFYNLAAFRRGASSLMPLEQEALGDVSGKSLLHLQCHFGQDTISWSRLGAAATGVDFSATAIATAQSLAAELREDTRFVEANVLDLHLEDRFDIVFTSYGVLTWLPDIQSWGEVAARHLKAGGVFFIAEFHPAMMMFDLEQGKYAYSYFSSPQPFVEEAIGSYADRSEGKKRKEYCWNYSLSEVINALMAQGLELIQLEEYPYSPYDCFPGMVPRPGGGFEVEALRGAPHLFTLLMRKPK